MLPTIMPTSSPSLRIIGAARTLVVKRVRMSISMHAAKIGTLRARGAIFGLEDG